MTKVKLMDIVVDPTIQVREVESHTVGTYAQAMRSGARFPPLIIEKGTNRLVAGNHRYYAYKSMVDPETTVRVEVREFEDDAAILRFAAKDNAQHGRPLDTWDKKRIVARLLSMGDNAEDLAALLGVSVKRVEEWAGIQVVVVGKRGKSTLRTHEPVKHGLEHMAGKEIDAEAYRAHERHDYGTPVKNMAAMITRHITDGLINTDDEKTMANLRDLYTALATLIKDNEVAA